MNDQFFHSREMFENQNIVHVGSTYEGLSLIEDFDFSAIVARDGHMATEASDAEKYELLGQLINRDHQTDCC